MAGKKGLHLSPTFLYFLLRKLFNFNKNKTPYSPSSPSPGTILFTKNFEYLVLTHHLVSATLSKHKVHMMPFKELSPKFC